MTGIYTDREYRTEALSRFQVDDYVAKPLAISELIELIKKHLGRVAQPAAITLAPAARCESASVGIT